MSSPIFQKLPYFIVKKVIDYLLNGDDFKLKRNQHIGASLPHSCSLWRQYFIKEAVSDMSITIQDPCVEISYPKWPSDIGLPAFPKNHLVKKISLCYRYWVDVVDDGDFDFFTSLFPSDVRFDSVVHVNVLIHFNPFNYNYSRLTVLAEILSYFRKLVPNITSIYIESFGYAELEYIPIMFMIDNVFCLARGVPTIAINHFDSNNFYSSSDMDAFTDLTSFTYCCQGFADAYHEAVRRSAASLKILSADYSISEGIDDILFDRDAPLIYPNMESLIIRFQEEMFESDLTSEFTHFPVLKKLCLKTRRRNYLDVFFNNHNVSYNLLEHLELSDQYGAFKYLLECYAFRSLRINNLKTVEFHLGENFTTDDYADRSEADETRSTFITLVMDATKSLHYLNIDDSMDESCFMRLLDIPQRFTCLKRIMIANIELDFLQMMLLLKTAPCLVRLDVRINNVPPFIKDKGPEEMVRFVETNYMNLGENIRKIGLSRTENDDMTMDCHLIVALAITCPDVINLFMHDGGTDDIKEELLRISQIEAFSNYSYHLELIAKKL